jgi:NDP-sugar pyrophosphorylase family protein
MAAGRGARMMPLTAVVPKPMAPYGGSTLIAEGIRHIRPEIKNIHVTVGYKGPKLAEHVLDLGVSSVFNTSSKGNAWWIYNTLLRHIDEPIFVLTCDNVVELDFMALEREYYRLNEPACLLVPVSPVPGLEGDYIFQEDNVVKKLDRQTPSDRYCSGIQILNPHQINRITQETEDFYCVWSQLIAKRQVFASDIYPKRWFGVDTFDQLCKLNSEGMIRPQTAVVPATEAAWELPR